jgi:8-oxo-dGTP pyrophosphatase MutT (NUDIX family)
MKTIIAAGGLVFNEKNELLMIFRRGFWDLPKGKLDKGETIESCAVREVEEETGIKNIELGKFAGITKHQYFDKHINEEVMKESHWFVMNISGKQKLIPQTEEDITEIRWVKKSELKIYLNKSYKNIVEIVEKYQSNLSN